MRSLSKDTIQVDLSPFIDALGVLETVTSARSKLLLNDGVRVLSSVLHTIAPSVPVLAATMVRDLLSITGHSARRAGATIDVCASLTTRRGA
jgi:hypothetical protein